MCNDSYCHKLLAVISTIHHQRICEPFNYGAIRFTEALYRIAASGVRDVDGGADLDVISTENQDISGRFSEGPEFRMIQRCYPTRKGMLITPGWKLVFYGMLTSS